MPIAQHLNHLPTPASDSDGPSLCESDEIDAVREWIGERQGVLAKESIVRPRHGCLESIYGVRTEDSATQGPKPRSKRFDLMRIHGAGTTAFRLRTASTASSVDTRAT